MYQEFKSEGLYSFVDASYAPDTTMNSNCQSVSGFLVFHKQNLIHWNTNGQSINTSSAAAEIVAIADNFSDIILPMLMEREFFGSSETTYVYIMYYRDRKMRRKKTTSPQNKNRGST